jgi:hypothetical protein
LTLSARAAYADSRGGLMDQLRLILRGTQQS